MHSSDEPSPRRPNRSGRDRRRPPDPARQCRFPARGTALLHTHQGPGIRCLREGEIRIDTEGRSASYGPGGAWFESGPEPVFAQASLDVPSRFIRAMVLPRSLLGASSIRYVNDEDRNKPKSQRYRVFSEIPIALDPA